MNLNQINNSAFAALKNTCKEEHALILSNRVTHLMKFPYYLQNAINSGDMSQLGALLSDCCTETVTLQPPNIEEIVGINEIMNYMYLLYRLYPDLITSYQPIKRYRRVMFCDGCTDGTMLSLPESYELPPRYDDLRAESFLSSKQGKKYLELKALGKPIFIRSYLSLHLILNSEMTHIEKIMYYRKAILVSDMKDVRVALTACTSATV